MYSRRAVSEINQSLPRTKEIEIMKESETPYEELPLPYKNLIICMRVGSRGKYEGCCAVENAKDTEAVVLRCTEKPDDDFLAVSKYVIEYAENQEWDGSVFEFPHKFPKYVLLDDKVFGKILKENTVEDLVVAK